MGRWSAILATFVATLAMSGCYDEATPGGVYACERDEDCRAGEVCRATVEHPDRLVCAAAAHREPDASTDVDGSAAAADADGAAGEEVDAVVSDAFDADVAPPRVDLAGPWRGFFHDRSERLFLLISQNGHTIEARVGGGEYGDWNDEVCEGELAGVAMTCGYYYVDGAGTPWLVETELTWIEANDALTGTWVNHKFPWLGDAITFTRYDPP